MENKDEQIRKELIYFIRKEKEYIESKVKPENSPKLMFLIDALAYLEKQKEQKPKSCDCSRDEESYTDGIHHVLMNPEAYGLIKQKPAEQLGGTFTSYDMAKTFTEGQNYVIAHPEKFGLCKPAEWKEKDEGMLNCIIATLCEESHGGRESNGKMVTWCENRLKSLRPSSKAKLTLLDENIINAAVAFVEQNDHFNCWGGIDKHTVIKALRSLKPHWKPSEEQMSALEYFIRSWGESGTMSPQNPTLCAAKTLLNDLKSL